MVFLNFKLVDKLIEQSTTERETIKIIKPKIQRVPAVLRIRKEKFSDLEKFYEPWWISVGPIHHGKPKYQLAEKYKHELVAKFVGVGGSKSWGDFYDQINKEKLKNILEECLDDEIAEEYEKKFPENHWKKLSDIVVFDGCAILQFIDGCDDRKSKGMKIKDDLVAFTQHDLFLLENQIPYRILALLIESRSDEDQEKLKVSIKKFIERSIMAPVEYQEDLKGYEADPEPAHLLDLLLSTLIRKPIATHTPHTLYISNTRSGNVSDIENMSAEFNHRDNLEETENTENGDTSDRSWAETRRSLEQESEFHVGLEISFAGMIRISDTKPSFRSVIDLKSAGIKFKPSKTSSPKDLHFSSFCFGGTLKLPPLLLDDSTCSKFMNLIAYEMCPDNTETEYEITSYVGLLDLLIDYPADVKELRSARILHHFLGCDDDVAQLFNKISIDHLVHIKFAKEVEEKIDRHYTNRWMTWMSQVCSDHFRSPWSIVALIMAVFVIGMSAIQTWYAVFPRENPCDGLCKRLNKKSM